MRCPGLIPVSRTNAYLVAFDKASLQAGRSDNVTCSGWPDDGNLCTLAIAGGLMPMDTEVLNTTTITPHEKAVQINVDKRFYGTYAEIGAGQEVARWFFKVGGASGTLAKTISAYDMAFSDAIYGKGERYVSQTRLQNMLDYEFALLIERLNAKRGETTSFFVFADTVSARNYLGTNECHGWMGVKFQMQPQAHPSEIILHVNMLDKENIQQQEALGIVGVNLTYGAFYLHAEPVKLIGS